MRAAVQYPIPADIARQRDSAVVREPGNPVQGPPRSHLITPNFHRLTFGPSRSSPR